MLLAYHKWHANRGHLNKINAKFCHTVIMQYDICDMYFQHDRVRVIYKYALDNLPKEQCQVSKYSHLYLIHAALLHLPNVSLEGVQLKEI